MYAFFQREIDRGLGFAHATKIVLLCTCMRLASILNCSDPAFGGAQNRRDRSLLTIVSESDSHCRLKVRQLPTKVVARRKNMVGVNDEDEAHTETIMGHNLQASAGVPLDAANRRREFMQPYKRGKKRCDRDSAAQLLPHREKSGQIVHRPLKYI